MEIGGITEIISHFVGELRIASEHERTDVLLDGALSRPPSPDVVRYLPHGTPVAPPVALVDGQPSPFVNNGLSDPSAFHAKLAAGISLPKAIAARAAPLPAAPHDPIQLTAPSGGEAQVYVHIAGGDLEVTQSHVDVVQTNILLDNDVFAPVMPGFEISIDPSQLWDLVKTSLSAGPNGLDVLELHHQSTIDAVAHQLETMTPESPAMTAMPQGTSIDGELVSVDAPFASKINVEFTNPFEGWTSDLQRPVEKLEPDHQVVAAGGNVAANAAIMVDGSGETTSMIVIGDVYRTNSIVQVNVLHDIDQVIVNGTSPPAVQSGGDHATNIAHFDNVQVYQNFSGAGFTSHWTATVLDGDFYSVQTLVQQNWILDNDLIVRQESSNAFELVTGHNTSVNNGGFIVSGMHYDMIVVTGDYFSTNRIYQHNVVLDDDRVTLSSADGTNASWQVDTGGNTLTNEAWIRDIGSGMFDKMTPQARAVAEAAMSGHSEAVANKMLGFSAPSDGTLDILVVKGNYYDMRIVSQTNVIGDADTVASLAPTPGSGAPGLEFTGGNGGTEAMMASATGDSAAQLIHTGGNAAANVAAIVNVGALANVQYAGGNIYEASTLIQTNIITTGTTTTQHPFDALAPEVVAFVDHDPYGHDLTAHNDALANAATLHPVTQNPDVMGSVMT